MPQLLDQLRKTDDLYFDSVSQVRLPAWARGRIALLGDAASCVSLFGDGSSLAVLTALECDTDQVSYEMTLLVEAVGDILTPAARAQ